jgi:hypothetical protein
MWRSREDRWLSPLAAREAKLMGTWRPGIRYLPTPSLRWTFRGVVLLLLVVLGAYALPLGLRRAAFLALIFAIPLGGLWAASRDLR